MKKNETAVVVLSGGQDSITCLGLALAKYQHVKAVSFDYMQRHAVELQAAARVCSVVDVPHTIVEVPALAKLVTSALTGEGDVSHAHPNKPGLPASFVPVRNALFLTLAHGYAQEHKASALFTGVCQTDFSGYPDCRDTFVRLLEVALNVGYESDIKIFTPLMYLDKAATFALAEAVDFLDLVLLESHTCYNGDHITSHAWGFGCGGCPACQIRERGYRAFREGNFNRDLVIQAVAG